MPHDIIDNRSIKLLDTIQEILPTTERAKFAVGYFFLSGLEAVEAQIANLRELRLLIGSTTNRQTIEQIAEGYRRLAEVKDAAEAMVYPKHTQIAHTVAQTSASVGGALAVMDQSDEAEALVGTLIRLIQEERLHVRVYTRGRLHAKAYIFDYPDGKGYENGIAVVGSSNFTLSGVSHNTELNVVVPGNANHAELTRWFEELWDEAEPFDAALMDELNRSWARAQVTPYEIYLKTLYELVRDRLEKDEEVPAWTGEITTVLTDFQARAVERAVRMIRQHGGCFVADVVGLGKSYIGAAVVKHFERTERARPLIVCPAPLVEAWERYNEAYQLNARVLSMGMLREGEDGGNLLLDDIRYRDRDFVLVDESHNFRNRDTQRYRVLEAYLAQGRRCVLLTATPRNKSAWDIFNQIKLFHQNDQTALPIDPPDIREYMKRVEAGERSLPALLSNILIRRTRNHILRWYGYDAETGAPVDPDDFAAYRSGARRAYVLVGGERNFFPRRELDTVTYSIEATYQGLYEQLRTYMSAEDAGADTLTYARYGLWRYVRENKQQVEPYVELQRAGANLRGLMRVSIFKRLESSVYAFRETLRRQLNILQAFLNALDHGIVAAGEDAQNLLYESDRCEEVELLDALEGVTGRYDIADFEADALRRDVAHDARIVEEMLAIVEPVTPARDAKLQRLLALLRSEAGGSKCLVFTQYADTANYLHKQIVAAGDWPGAEVIFSDRKGKLGLVARFAPKANPDFYPEGRPEIDLLVATDVLSEGLNLQDCSRVINYDLHWNPVRLIQRFGRIDRIGSEHDVIYGHNFLPETGLDEHLGLRERLQRRIEEIHSTIGEDAAVLDPEEQLNEDAMYAIYDARDIGAFEEETEEALMDLEEAEEVIRQLERDRPALFERVRALRDGVRCGRQVGEAGTFVFCRAGDYRRLYLLDEAGEVASRDVPYILGRLRCDEDERPVALPGGYNAQVTAVKWKFEAEVRDRRAESWRAVSLTGAQKYVIRELNLLYSLVQDDAAMQGQITALEAAFRQAMPRAVQRRLNELRRQNLGGEMLLAALMQLYERHNLGARASGSEVQADGEDDVPRIVCSEAFCN